MEINIETIIDLYQNKLSITEKDLIMTQAQVITLQNKIEKLENLLKENNIDIVQ